MASRGPPERSNEVALSTYDKAVADWNNLVQLSRSAGAFVSESIGVSISQKSGRGVSALAPLRRNDLLMALPAAIFTHAQNIVSAYSSWAGLIKHGVSEDGVVSLFIARVQMGVETFESGQSILPEIIYENILQFPPCSNALFMSEELLALLPPWSKEAFQRIRTTSSADWKHIKSFEANAPVTFNVLEEEFREGFCQFASRNFRFGVGGKSGALVPLLDWFNHRPPINVNYNRQLFSSGTLVQGDAYVAFIVDAVAPGDELFNDYGLHTAGGQLAIYGFYDGESQERHARSWVPEIPLNYPPLEKSDPNYIHKVQALSNLRQPPMLWLGRQAVGGYGFDGSAVKAVGIIMLNATEYTGDNVLKIGKNELVLDVHRNRVREFIREQCRLARALIPSFSTSRVNIFLGIIGLDTTALLESVEADARLRQLAEGVIALNKDQRRVLTKCIDGRLWMD